jgi:hypothetical protein
LLVLVSFRLDDLLCGVDSVLVRFHLLLNLLVLDNLCFLLLKGVQLFQELLLHELASLLIFRLVDELLPFLHWDFLYLLSEWRLLDGDDLRSG